MIAIVVVNMTTAFAWSWDDKDNGNDKNYNGPYSHVSIAVGTENNGEWQLAEKPTIYTEVEETYCTKCEEGKKHKVCNSEGKRIVDKEITLGNKQNSNNNGTEYQSDMNYSFTTDTVFTVTAKFTNGTKTTDTQIFTISNVENYKDSGLTFYQYCCKNYCDNHTGIDMKLSYEELVANFYDVQYVVEGNVSTDIIDGNDYEAGDEVTVTEDVPSKDGYEFVGWQYGEEILKAGNTIIMPEENITLTAVFAKVDGVTYDLNGGEGDISDDTSYRVGYDVTVSDKEPVKDGYRFDGWTLNDDTETLYQANDMAKMVEGGLIFKAQWTKLYNVYYYVDTTLVETKTFPEGTDVTNEVAYVYDLKDDSKTITDFALETENANLASINSDLVYKATTSAKTFTVTYYVDGVQYGEPDTVEYGSKVDVNAVSYTPDVSRDFCGWTVTSGNVENVTTDIVISGTTKVKKFTVIYKVDGETVETVENVEYGTKLYAYVYTPAEGYNVSEFTNLDKLASVTDNVVLEAETSIKTFTVVFLDNDGTVLSSEKYDYGTQITVPANPKKADSITDGDEATQTPAKWYKFNFNSWTASGDYTTDSSVTQDMTFTAKYNRWEVVVKYYVLDAGLAQPSELDHYPVANYSKGVVGSVYHFTEIANNDDALAANLANVPAITAFTLEDVDGNVYTPNEDQSIKWYVLKKETDNWHVDGIITNQMYTVTVNYLEKDTDKVLAESMTQSVAAGTEYTAKADIVEGYVLSSDKAEVTGTMPYDNVTVNFYYEKQSYTLTVNHYVGETLLDTESSTLKFGEEYTAKAKTFEGYILSSEKAEVTDTMPSKDVTVDFFYAVKEAETTTEETTIEEATTEETTTEETTTEETTTEETTTEETTTEETTTEEATTEETTTEEASTDEEIIIDDEDLPLDGGNPKTGDSSSNAGYLAALSAAVLAGISSVFGRKKVK